MYREVRRQNTFWDQFSEGLHVQIRSRITRVSHRNGACNVNLDVRIKADF